MKKSFRSILGALALCLVLPACEKVNDNKSKYDVDLALPSGTIWCSMDVGAASEYEAGVFLAWGESIEKYEYNWMTYERDELLNDTQVLPCTYDAASLRMGEQWRTPTRKDFEELLANTVKELVTIREVDYMKFTGSNGRSIFFRMGSSYWSSDIRQAKYSAYGLTLDWEEGAIINDPACCNACYIKAVKCTTAPVSLTADIRWDGKDVIFEGSYEEDPSAFKSVVLDIPSAEIKQTADVRSDKVLYFRASGLSQFQQYGYSIGMTDIYGRTRTGQNGTIEPFKPEVRATIENTAVFYSTAKISAEYSTNFSFDEIRQAIYVGAAASVDELVAQGRAYCDTTTSSTINRTIDGLKVATSYNWCIRTEFVSGSDINTYSSEIGSFTTLEVPEGAVDLGLSSGRLWKAMNLDAKAPGDCGGYYAYADMETKTSYTWDNCKYYYQDTSHGGKTSSFSKYVVRDVLEAEEDVVIAKLGGQWHMPTLEDCSELARECTAEAGTAKNSKGEEVNGFWIVGPNSNRMFLPACGYYDGTALKYPERVQLGASTAGLWGPAYRTGLKVSASDGTIKFEFDWGSNRYLGMCIRPVI